MVHLLQEESSIIAWFCSSLKVEGEKVGGFVRGPRF